MKILSSATFIAALALLGCGSESNKTDAGKDKGLRRDARADRGPLVDEGLEQDLAPRTDGSVDGPAADGPAADGPRGDGTAADAPPAASNGRCAGAIALAFAGGKATASGDTKSLTDEFATLACQPTGATSPTTMEGPQAYYKFPAQKDSWYRLILDPTFSAFLYVFTSSNCAEADIQKDCQSSGASGESSSEIAAGVPEAVYFKAPADGDVLLAVDSADATDAGSFKLTVEQITAPGNGTCAQATALTFSGGTAEARGDTDAKLTPDEFPAAAPWEGVLCGGAYAFDGPQAYFKFDATAGKAYNITLSAEAATYLYAYVFGASCAPADVEAGCASAGVAGDVLGRSSSSGDPQTFLFMPEASGSYTLAVDSRSPAAAGAFSLTIEEVTPAANTTCASAVPITLTAGKGTASGSTKLAKNEFGLGITCGLGGSIVGPQVYYEFTAQANKGYRITLKPDFTSYFYTFQKASCGTATAIDTDCASGTTGANWGAVFPETEGTMFFRPSAAGQYLIAIDSAGNAAVGDFTLDIEEVDPPTNTTCSAAAPITLTSGEATVRGSTGFSKDEFAGLTCSSSGDALDGPQLYYELAMQTGRFYELRYTPAFYDGYVYVFSPASCSEAALSSDCTSQGATGAVSGPAGFSTTPLYFVPPSAGTYKIGVDSALSTQYADEFGDFILDVTERSAASNGSCAQAKALTLTNNKAVEEGYTVLVPNEFGTEVQCGAAAPTLEAGQVYYKVDLTGGTEYLFKLFPDFDAQLVLFPAASGGGCPTTAEISSACGGTTGGYAAIEAGGKGGIVFKPAASGSYFLVVDGEAGVNVGGFRLEIDTPPANQTCATPQSIALASSPASAAGDTSLGVADDLDVACGNAAGPWPGPQLYYKITLQQGVAYTITVSQQDWDPALYAFPATVGCTAADVDLACTSPTPADPNNIFSSDGIGVGDETIKIKPATTGDWIVVVDSFDDKNYPSGRGPFTLAVSW